MAPTIANTVDFHINTPSYIRPLMLYFVESFDNVNFEAKCEELFGVLTRDNVYLFLNVLIHNRITKDDVNLEMLADLVMKIDDRFPGGREVAVRELLKPIKRVFGSIPADGMDFGKEADLRNLGRFLGLLTLAQNKTFISCHLDLKDLVLEGITKGDNALRYVVQFVCQFLKASFGSVYHPFHSSNLVILKYLRMIYEKDDVMSEIKTEIDLLFEHLRIGMKLIPRISQSTIGAPLGDPIIKYEESGDSPFH
ncbi:unnamed protein product [Hymenolepis diminuta]|uniref:CCR4-NOT transcription complex subunit 1 CAF1-binding domain-containing protein n=1 Tax=Hymenolepis diminuta TaxID=6216 RepID=A0A564YUX6_HYMDI|nr:unnamed protein product [Hymenolepis diminuta]